MRKRIRRIVLTSVTVIGVLASVSFAGPGPGGVTDGDPDTPHFMKPSGYGEVVSQDVSGSAAPGVSTKVATEPTYSLWERVLQAYLSLKQFFLL